MPLARLKELNTTDCLWTYILKILTERPTHAYTIRAEIHKRYGFRPGIMTAYKVLYLLNRKGFVRKAEDGRKKIYTVTPKGRDELKKAVAFYKKLGKSLSS